MKTATTTEGADADATPRVVLLLGSNVHADAQLDRALAALAAAFELDGVSARHRSAATVAGAPAYENQAVALRCALGRDVLKVRLREVEASLGRVRPAPDEGLCPIDIDAIGRWSPAWETWDTKGYLAPFARAPLADLGVPRAPVAPEPPVDPPHQDAAAPRARA